MKWKLDENGNFMPDEKGNPIAIFDSGKEDGFDAVSHINTNNNLQNKVDSLKADALKNSELIASFEGINAEEAKAALERVSDLKDDDARVSELQQANVSLRDEIKSINKDFGDREEKLKHDNFIDKLSADFSGSDFRSDKTNLTPEMAYLLFKDNFKNEEVDGKMVKVGYLNGEKIRSQETGNIADFGESFQRMFDAHPDKNHFLKATTNGGNGAGDGEIDSNENITTGKLTGTREERIKTISARFPGLE